MSQSRPVSRRQFLQTAGAVAGGVALGQALAPRARGAGPPAAGGGGAGGDFSVTIVSTSDPITKTAPVEWALACLKDAFAARGVAVRDGGNFTLRVQGTKIMETFGVAPPESFNFHLGEDEHGKTLMLLGADALGLAYGLTELADRVRLMPEVRAALAVANNVPERPANRIRGIMRLFVSEVEDKRWFYDQDGWRKYFDMLVTQRFNRFNLAFGLSYDFARGLTDTYTFFMYPFFINVPGHDVQAVAKGGQPLAAEEQKKNLDTLKFISNEAAARGLQFHLGVWTHSYTWTASPNATYTISGLTAQTQAPYSREALHALLEACPGITGVTLRTHGESGVPEGSYGLWKIIMSGITGLKNSDGTARTIELDMHAKTMTREMIDTALTTGMPVTLSCKFWAEHMGLPYVQASIREQEMPRAGNGTGLMALSSGTRSFLRYGIGDLLAKDRKYKVIHRVWPGTQRLLLWGDPLYAAEYGRVAHFAGMDGIEYFEPLSFKGRAGSSMNIPAAPDRSGYADATLRTEHDWEKYLYTFRLWGRLSYNPDATPDTWQRAVKAGFGLAAVAMEKTLASASRILPLITTAHDPAAANAIYWPENYVNMSLYDPTKVGPYSEAPSPKVFGNVTALDPQLFASVNEYVDSLLAAKPLAKIPPLEVSRQLDAWSGDAFTALGLVGKIGTDSPAIRRARIDASIAAGIGQFFAHKFRAAILWQLFNLSAHEPARAAALGAYKQARDVWAVLAGGANVYVDDLTFGADRQLRRHWKERLADLDADIAGLTARAAQARATAYPAAAIDKLIEAIINPPQADSKAAAPPQHTPPVAFTPNQALGLELAGAQRFEAVRLCYRHVHQGERYAAIDMQKSADKFAAAIPAAYTNSAFPLQYYFEVHTGNTARPFPGFRADFTGQPYFMVQPA